MELLPAGPLISPTLWATPRRYRKRAWPHQLRGTHMSATITSTTTITTTMAAHMASGTTLPTELCCLVTF
jgi:hypothetical protein